MRAAMAVASARDYWEALLPAPLSEARWQGRIHMPITGLLPPITMVRARTMAAGAGATGIAIGCAELRRGLTAHLSEGGKCPQRAASRARRCGPSRPARHVRFRR